MHIGNRKRTLGLALIVAAAAAVFIGIAASTHTPAASAVPTRHVGTTNELALSSASQPVMTSHSFVKGGVCYRCIVAHPYEASMVGA